MRFYNMCNKIIFLDIDGVINSTRTCAAYKNLSGAYFAKMKRGTDEFRAEFDPIAVRLIENLVIEANAKIVISSSWRAVFSLDELQEMFHREYNWPSAEGEYIIDVTPEFPRSSRGAEIQHWIDNNTVGIPNFRYIIIDDGYDFLDNHFTRLIQTDPYEGFLVKDYNRALELFDLPVKEYML